MSARLAALALAATLASCAGDCRGRSRQGGEAGEAGGAGGIDAPVTSVSGLDAGRVSAFARLGQLPAVEPRWQVTLPGSPGAARGDVIVDHVAGPVVVPGTEAGPALVLAASSAVGVVAIAAGTGDVRWQHAGEDAPGWPLVAGEEIWLPGRCLHRIEEAQALMESGAPDEYVLGCVDIVERAGAVRERTWLRVAADALHGSARRSHALGRNGENLLWAHGVDLLELSVPGGRVVAHQRVVPADHIDDGTAITGWIDDGPQRIVATTTGLAAFAACPARGVCAPAWHQAWPRAVGVTGPVKANGFWGEANEGWVWVRDQTLEAGGRGRIAWTADGFHAYAPGSLLRTDDGLLLALRLSTAGIQPVRIDPKDGRAVEEGVPVPGAQVLVAAPWGQGVAAVVRLDASLRHDAVIAWDERLRVRWAWPLPEPTGARVAPVGLTALPDDAGVVVFYDGRALAHLPFEPR
jgi:hypothetical protein